VSRKAERCSICGVRTPVTYEHAFRVKATTERGALTLVNEWTETAVVLCPKCHDRIIEMIDALKESCDE